MAVAVAVAVYILGSYDHKITPDDRSKGSGTVNSEA